MKTTTTLGQVAFDNQTLAQVGRLSDCEADASILCTHKWYLESGRPDWLITPAPHRIQTVDAVISDLKQWVSVLEIPARPTNSSN